MLWFSCGNLGFEQDILKDHDAPFRKVTCIGAHSQSGRNSSKMLLDHIQDRFDFTDVIGFLKKMGGHDHLICIIRQGLTIIALIEGLGAAHLHNPRIEIGGVPLGLVRKSRNRALNFSGFFRSSSWFYCFCRACSGVSCPSAYIASLIFSRPVSRHWSSSRRSQPFFPLQYLSSTCLSKASAFSRSAAISFSSSSLLLFIRP